MWTAILGFLAPLVAPLASHFVDAWIRKFVKDRELLEAWEVMMSKIQGRTWLKGSTPSEYANAGKDQQPPGAP